MRQVAEDEHIDAEKIREGVEAGHIVIPANKNHRSLHAYGIGEGLRTKMNVNLGVSKDCHDYSVEQPRFQEIRPGHFVYASDSEMEKYRKELEEQG